MMLTKTIIISFVSLAAFALLFAIMAIIKIKLSDPQMWYKLLHKTTQDKVIKSLLDQRPEGQEFHKDTRTVSNREYTTYLYDHFYSNNTIISDDQRQEGEKTNSERQVVVRFGGMLGGYDPRDVARTDFDDVLRVIYPKDPKNVDDPQYT